MAKVKADTIPGSYLQKLVAFVWYGLIISLWLGIVSFLDEFIRKVEKYDYDALPKRSGETVVLTGGTRGIGLEVLKKLLRLDYRIIIGARNPAIGEKVIDTIRKSGIKTGSAKCFSLDLKSLKSVRSFAQNVLKGTNRIDLLINNAGIMFTPYELTQDLMESQFQVNFLSHHLLTQLLLPKIKSTGDGKQRNCRIIHVSSVAHYGSYTTNFEDVPNPNVYSSFRAYYDSKLSQVLSMKYLNTQLKSQGAKVSVYALHPGVIPTDLYSSLDIFGKLTHMLKVLFRNTDDGSEVILYTAISPELEDSGGSYIGANLESKTPSIVAQDVALQARLWSLSEGCLKSG